MALSELCRTAVVVVMMMMMMMMMLGIEVERFGGVWMGELGRAC